jgi:hypothetical protein
MVNYLLNMEAWDFWGHIWPVVLLIAIEMWALTKSLKKMKETGNHGKALWITVWGLRIFVDAAAVFLLSVIAAKFIFN